MNVIIRWEILHLNVTYLEEDITYKCYIIRRVPK